MTAVFITGASSGLGRALAIFYAQQGAVLGLVGRNQERLEQLRQSLPVANQNQQDQRQHQIYVLDVTDNAALRSAAEQFIASVGTVHIVIASAGISVGTLTEDQDDLAVFAQVMACNVNATVATFAPFIAHMRQHAHASRLVGIASVAGIRGLPGASAYSASKAAVIAYCESLRVELRGKNGTGIKVVTIAPGYIDTPMTQVNDYRMPFLMPAAQFADQAARAIAAGKSYIVIPWQMGVVAKLLRCLPNPVYDWLFSRAPRKARTQNQG